jgi:hypothetical protein
MNATLRFGLALGLFVLLRPLPTARADDAGTTLLTPAGRALEAFAGPNSDWVVCGDAALDDKNPRLLKWLPGHGTLAPRSGRSAGNLVTRERFTDLEVHVEFLIARGSNSGVKLMGLYEIQIADSFGKKELTGSDCGGIYPRGEEQPRYHVIDKGFAPRVNAAKPAGEWQSLDIAFRAPRFGPDGRKTAPARFVRVALNGQTVHEDIDIPYPTGAAWRQKKEGPNGPLLLQGDHGPVAFRNLRVRKVGK